MRTTRVISAASLIDDGVDTDNINAHLAENQLLPCGTVLEIPFGIAIQLVNG